MQMNKLHLLLAACCILLTSTAFSQLKFNIKAMPDADTYGVYLKPCGDLTPSSNTITGTGQATVVLPLGNDANNLKAYAGVWTESGAVSAPDEAPSKNYFSFGFLADSPKIVVEAGKETLLFTFKVEGSALGAPQLLDNDTDPFANFPNSANSNPGNEISMLDFGVSPVGYYYYSGNFTDDDPTSCTGIVDTTIVEPTDTTIIEPTDTTQIDTTMTGGGTTTSAWNQVAEKEVFILSPNPTSFWVNVEFSNVAAYSQGKIRLWTAQGISIGEMVRNGQKKLTVNVGGLPNGFYFISFESGGKVLQRERFIKQ